MDPNEALRIIRLTIKQQRVDEHPLLRTAHSKEIAEHFEALDEWLTKGGFLPTDWRKHTGGTNLGENKDKRRIAHLEDRVDRRTERILKLEKELHEDKRRIAHLEDRVDRRTERILKLEKELHEKGKNA